MAIIANCDCCKKNIGLADSYDNRRTIIKFVNPLNDITTEKYDVCIRCAKVIRDRLKGKTNAEIS